MFKDYYVQIENWILKAEGGYVNDPNDPGGETKYGISKAAYPDLDIAGLTINQAMDIYEKDYWNANGLDNYDIKVAFMLFDIAVLQGAGVAQDYIGELAPYLDNPYKSVIKLSSMRQWSLVNEADSKYYYQDWIKRNADLEALILSL